MNPQTYLTLEFHLDWLKPETIKELKDLEENSNLNPNPNSENYFENFPDELMLLIFQYLDKPFQLGFCSCVNNQFNRISNDWSLWKPMLKKYRDKLDFLKLKLNYRDAKHFEMEGSNGICQYFLKNSNENENKNEIQNEKKSEYQNEYLDFEDQNIKIVDENQLKKITEEIEKDPRKVFQNQAMKINGLKKMYEKHKRKIDFENRVSNFKDKIVLNPFVMGLAFILGMTVPLILIILKLENKIDISWVVAFLPIFYTCIHLGMVGSVKILEGEGHGDRDIFLFWSLAAGSVIFMISLIFGGLKLDQKGIFKDTPIFVCAIPFFVLSILISTLVTLQILQQYRDKRYPFYFSFTTISLIIYFPIYTIFFSIFLILASLKVDYNFDLSWTKCFIPLFICDFLPVIGITMACLYRATTSHVYYSSIHQLNFIQLIVGTTFFAVEIMLLRKWDNKLSISYWLISLPILIPEVLGNLLIIGILIIEAYENYQRNKRTYDFDSNRYI
ncbi:fam11a b protein [Anaeramoeba ignava]|uniref:Fam11a b protein n=1 Tax=Anaeramoeba ignava TaxID=1746090 RepID=A0A9Q0LD92_ANAIG|nr:fam11a b protein [Anaeramoeba ignava]